MTRDKKFSYEFEWEDRLYEAGVERVHSKRYVIKGDVYLNTLKITEKRVPYDFLSLPFWTLFAPSDKVKANDVSYLIKDRRRKNIYTLYNITIARCNWGTDPKKSLESFVELIGQRIRRIYPQQVLNREEIEFFFSTIHQHYQREFRDY